MFPPIAGEETPSLTPGSPVAASGPLPLSPNRTPRLMLYEIELGIPVTDALSRPSDALVEMVLLAFPALRASRSAVPNGTAVTASKAARRITPVWRLRTPRA
jgi:hypothetical protein